MAAKLGEDPDELVAELVRQIAQSLANGESADKVADRLTKSGASRDQAAKLVDAVVQARRRHENSAEGRAQNRSQAVSRMIQGALWGAGGVVVTLLSMGSGGGRVFFGAVIYGAYLLISGLVLWGGNTAQLGDDEELKAGPGWLRDIRVGESVRDTPKAASVISVPQSRLPTPTPVPPPLAAPAKVTPRPIPRPVTTAPRPAARPAARPPALSSKSTTITRLYAFAFLWDQILGLALPFNIFGRLGLGKLIGPFYVLSVMTFVAGILCAVHVVQDKLEYRFLALPAYHVVGVVLIYQFWKAPELQESLSIVHSVVGLIVGLAWIWHTREVRGRVTQTRVVPRPVVRPPTSRPPAKPAPRV